MGSDSRTAARTAIAAVQKGRDPHKVLREMVSHEDELSTTVGLGSGATGAKLGELGYTQSDSKDFPAGSIQVWTAPNPEHPSESGRVFVVVGADGVTKAVHSDAGASQDPEFIATRMQTIAKAQGLTRPAGTQVQPSDGGAGFVAPQA